MLNRNKYLVQLENFKNDFRYKSVTIILRNTSLYITKPMKLKKFFFFLHHQEQPQVLNLHSLRILDQSKLKLGNAWDSKHPEHILVQHHKAYIIHRKTGGGNSENRMVLYYTSMKEKFLWKITSWVDFWTSEVARRGRSGSGTWSPRAVPAAGPRRPPRGRGRGPAGCPRCGRGGGRVSSWGSRRPVPSPSEP